MTRQITGRHRRNKLDLNSKGDRDYLSSRGFAFALIAVGARRGRVISAHYQRKTAEAYVRDFASSFPLEIVEIAKFAPKQMRAPEQEPAPSFFALKRRKSRYESARDDLGLEPRLHVRLR
jgi:hypothetical protein